MAQDLLVFFYFFIGQQNLRQECLQLRHGWILVLWSLDIINLGMGGLSLRENNYNLQIQLVLTYCC